MAQDSFDAIVNAVMLAESGGRRFDKQGNLLTSSKGAQGEMQVMPGTAKSPGYGVAPAQDRSPEELARVGRDYLKSMLDKYGELDKALAAYNWGPGNTDKWIAAGADPKKLPSETRSYIDKIKSTLGGERVADRSSKPAASPALAPAQRPPTARGGPLAFPVQRTADLGTSYQAALALSFLADEAEREDERREYDDREPSTAQKWLASATPKVSPEMLAMPYSSPFGPEPEPVRAADGGFIAVGYDTPPAYRDGGEARIDRIKRTSPGVATLYDWSRTVAEDMYPRERDVVKRDAARHMLASAIMANKTNAGIAEGIGKAYELKEAPLRTMGHWLGVSQPRSDYMTDTANNALGATLSRYAKDPLELQRVVRASIEKGEANLTPDVPEVPKYKEGGEVSDEPTAEELERASKAAFGIVPSSGKGRKAGRVTEALQSGQAQTEAAKGATLLPQNIVGAPVDIATLLMRPLGYNVEKPVMGSEWLKEKSRQAGVAFPEPTDPTLRAFYTAGDIGSNLVNPAGATRTAVKGVEKTGQAAKMLAEMATRPVERDPLLSGSMGSQRGAVRLPGGSFIQERRFVTGPETNYQTVEQYGDPVSAYVMDNLSNTSDPVLNKWFDQKIAMYLRRDIGTENDPFVKAAEEGRKSHIFPLGALTPADELSSRDWAGEILRLTRKSAGFPESGMAKTQLGRIMENYSDSGIYPTEIQDVASMKMEMVPPGLRRFVTEDPSMPLYSLQPGLGHMDLRGLKKSMLEMRQQPKEYSAYGQPPKTVPEQYRLMDAALEGLTPAQASERVAQFGAWRQETRQRMASKALFEDPSLDKKVLDGGYVMINAPDLEAYPRVREIVQDVGCDGNWCTREEHHALDYGSGENRLSILFDSKARPKAQLTINRAEPSIKDFLRFEGEPAAVQGMDPWSSYYEDAVLSSPEFQQWARSQPANVSITEIKGFNNETKLQKEPYVGKVQQFVKDLDRQYDLENAVDNLDGIGLTAATAFISHILRSNSLPISLDLAQAVRNEVRRLNGGSSFVEIDMDKVMDATKGRRYLEDAVSPLILQAYKNVTKSKE